MHIKGKYSESKQDNHKNKKSSSSSSSSTAATKLSNNSNHIPGVTADALIEMIIQIHSTCVEQQGAVPRDYMAFLKMWYNLCLVKKAELINEVGHLEAGRSSV
jgi:hypothetical protein